MANPLREQLSDISESLENRLWVAYGSGFFDENFQNPNALDEIGSIEEIVAWRIFCEISWAVDCRWNKERLLQCEVKENALEPTELW